MASTHKVVVLVIDGRGTGGRGRRFENAIYKKIGIVEVQDQIDGIK